MEERRGVLTFNGKPVTLVGVELKTGQKAPEFRLVDTDLNEVRLSDSRGKVRLLSVVPSLDTPVCDLQTQRFEQEASNFPDMVVYTISMDLPYAQARYCSALDIKNMKTLSDHREAAFGKAYGVLIKELRLLCRAIFIIDGQDVVRYAEYVPEVNRHPDYSRALRAVGEVAAGAAAGSKGA